MFNGVAHPMFWLILAVVLVAVEVATLGIVIIWFAIGALVAVFVAMFNFSFIIQTTVFIVVSAILLIFTRPIVKNYLSVKKQGTNADRVIGEYSNVIETINNGKATGRVKVLGKEWSARSVNDKEIQIGKKVKVLKISGVKLIVEETEE
jgi:membrane protein implicated in regulation of membrane protease activity